jgi:Putative zinc-finger
VLTRSNPKQHVQDEQLERYSLGRMTAPEVDHFEEHLLVCEPCRLRLSAMDEYIAVMKAASSSIQRKGPRSTTFYPKAM